MSNMESGQVSSEAAEVYESRFVPALFAEWAEPVSRASGASPGNVAVDVGCGTGVVARMLAERVGSSGRAIGVDPNEGMLSVARRRAPGVDWRVGHAEQLPLDDASADAVTCQFAMMFFSDRAEGVREMLRIVKPGGRVAVAVWDRIDNSPGFRELARVLERLFGAAVAAGLHAPFCLGDRDALRACFADAGASSVQLATRTGTARFPSIAAWLETNVRGWTLSEAIDDDGYRELEAVAEREFAPFVQNDGSLQFAAPAHIATFGRG